MFKTIFRKMMVIFIAILLISFSIAGLVLNYFLDNSVTKQKIKTLEQGADNVVSFLNYYMEHRDIPLVNSLVIQQIQINSRSTNSLVWVANTDGMIGDFTSNLPKVVLKKFKQSDSGLYLLPDDRQFKKVMQEGKVVEERGDFYGLFSETGNNWLVIEKPFIYKNKVIGAVYLSTTLAEIDKNRKMILNFFLIAVAVSTVVSFVLVFIFSRRITKPLKQIKHAASQIAGGEFQKRLDIKSRDEIGELAENFNHMAAALENLEEMRRGFIANVSHELRTPMTSIRGFVEGILDGTIPYERQNSYLNIVRDETIRLNRLVNDLLDLARMESGEMTLNLKTFNVTELIRRCIIKMENQIVDKGISVEASFEEEDMPVFADSDAIERVVINLVHNAVKFTNENGIIKLSAFAQKDKILVSVEDNGAGIASEELDLIWDRFYKSDKSRGKDKTGTGLGLAIIKSILNEHNERVWVESQLGKGTKFTFTLRKAQGEQS